MEYNFNISPISMGVILFQCYDIKIKIITTDKVFFFFGQQRQIKLTSQTGGLLLPTI